MNLERHHLERIDRLAKALGESDVDILTQAIYEGAHTSPAALTSWLWQRCVDAGLEAASEHVDSAKAVNAWAALEAGWRDSEAQIEVTELDP